MISQDIVLLQVEYGLGEWMLQNTPSKENHNNHKVHLRLSYRISCINALFVC